MGESGEILFGPETLFDFNQGLQIQNPRLQNIRHVHLCRLREQVFVTAVVANGPMNIERTATRDQQLVSLGSQVACREFGLVLSRGPTLSF